MNLITIRSTFDNITNALTRSRDKVLFKFLVLIILGISKTKTLNLSEIGRELEVEEKTTARHIQKKLSSNLGIHDLTKIKDSIQSKQAKLVDENTYIYFDPSEVVKEYGKKFEAMCKVCDGSDNRIIKNGYPIISCVGLKQEELIPLDLDLYSYNEESFESENQKEIFHIDSIANRCKRKGIFVLDRGFDRFAIIRHISQNAIDFIIRMTMQRKYYLAGKYGRSYARHEIINKHSEMSAKTICDLKVKKRLEKVKFTIKAVRVDLLGGKIDTNRDLWLIRARSNKCTLYLLTNIENISKETLVEIFQAYLNRWKVEEFIRFAKQQYGMEKSLTRKLAKIRNLIRILFMTIVVLTRLSEFKYKYSKTRAILINKSKRMRKLKLSQKLKFYCYMLADGLSNVLKIITKKVMNMKKRKPNDQLKFDFGEFGGVL